jgi:hypothetical protein
VAARTSSNPERFALAALIGLALAGSGCAILDEIPSPRGALAAIAGLVGGDTISNEYAPPGIFTRATGAYMTTGLELDAAKSVAAELPPGDLGVVVIDALPDDVKLTRSFADELYAQGRTVVRLKPADLGKPGLPPVVLWILPRAGGLESVKDSQMYYQASVRVVAQETATKKILLAKTIERSSCRDRVADVLQLADK